MIIKRELKNVIYEYDFETKKLYFILPNIEDQWVININRTEMFSLARFILSVAQKSARKRRGKKNGS